MSFDTTFIRARVAQSADVIASLAEQAGMIERIGRAVRATLAEGGRLFTCGNGGSAAEALHLAEELIGRYKRDRRPFAALSLNADPTALTCIANDYGFEDIFARQVEALASRGDVLVVFSTSGNSPNIVKALEAARRKGVGTIGLLGKGGGACAPLCDHALVVATNETEHVQEAHQVVLHLILEAVEGS
jgi:D-sedoheptulose 7-phosphate isomerase